MLAIALTHNVVICEPVVCSQEQLDGAALLRRADVVVSGLILRVEDAHREALMFFEPLGKRFFAVSLRVTARVDHVYKGKLSQSAASPGLISFTYWQQYEVVGSRPDEGVSAGPALIPLRITPDGYRAIQDCWMQVIPLHWRDTRRVETEDSNFEQLIAELLLSDNENSRMWPITRTSLSIVSQLVGPSNTVERLERLAGRHSPAGLRAGEVLCRQYGRCAGRGPG